MTGAHHRAAITERAARAGGAVARKQFRGELAVETKSDKNDLVTATDRDAQQQVVATVREEFPDDVFVGEEDSVQLTGPETETETPRTADAVPDEGACWVIDPIDGTSNYVRGVRTWTTSVAAVEDGETVGATTYLPAMGDLYSAGPESATRDGETLRVSEREDPETFAVAAVGKWDTTAHEEFGEVCGTIVERFGEMRRVGSFQATLAYVADGGLDAAISTGRSSPWDTVAGVHLVRRAGGTVTDPAGDPWEPDSDGLIASSGVDHGAVLDATRATTES